MHYTLDPSAGTLRIKLGPQQVLLRNESLQSGLAKIVDAGGIFVNSAKLRAESISSLPTLSGAELRAQLSKVVDGLVQPLPSTLILSAAQGDMAVVLNNAKQNLIATINSLPESDARALAQSLANGMLFVRDTVNRRIVAVQGETDQQLEDFKDRLQKFQQKVASELINNTVNGISKITSDINTKAQGFINNNDDGGLSKFAGDPNGELSIDVNKIKEQLGIIQQQIQDARTELEDKKTEATIAQYEDESSRYFAQAADLGVGDAELRARKAALIRDASVTELEKAKLVQAASTDETLARQQEVQVAELSLRQTYLACLAQGFNPVIQAQGAVAEASESPTLHAFLYGINNPWKRAGIAKMTSALAGMLQWINLLHVTASRDNRPFLTLYSDFVHGVESNDISALQALETTLSTQFKSQTTDQALVTVRSDASRDATGDHFVWFDSLTKAEHDEWLANVPQEWRDRAVGAFTYTVSLNPGTESDPFSITLIYGPKYSYYALLEDLAVVKGTSASVPSSLGYYFYLVPDQNPMPNPNESTAGVSNGAKQLFSVPVPISSNFLEDTQTQKLRNELLNSWNDLDLSGALGKWTFYLLTSPAPTPDQLTQLKGISLHVFMPYVSVKH